MLHLKQRLKVYYHLVVTLALSCYLNSYQSNAQIVDTVVMHDTGHDAAAWWNSLCSWADTLNGGDGEFMQCQRWTWNSLGCGQGEQIPHIRFDLPTIPPNHILDKVELQLFFPSGNPFPHTTGNNDIYVQRITNSWDEATLNWVNKPNYTTANQVSVSAATSGTQTYTMDITDIAQLWFGMTPNFGVRLKLQNPTIYRRATFASSEHPDPALHPRIYFTFLPNYSITTSASDTVICDGEAVDIETTFNGMISPTFSWTSIPIGFSSTNSNITVSPTQNTRYIVAVADTGQTLYDTVDIDVYNCCAIDTMSYKRFHKSFSGAINEPYGTVLGGRADLTADGDLLLASHSSAFGGDEALLTKINSNGNYNWTRAYNLPNYDAGLSTLELSTGEYLLVGHTNSVGSGKVSLFMQKVDVNGTGIIWTRVYDQILFDIVTAFITELSNGDIVVTSLASTGTGQGIAVGHFDDSGFVISYDYKTLFGKGDLMVNDVIATSDGGFLLCGEAKAGMANDYDGALLMQFNSAATLNWAQVYRFPSSSGVYNLGSFNPAEISVTNAYSILEDVGRQRYIVVGDASDIYSFTDALIWEVDALNGSFLSSRKLNYSGHESSYLGLSQSNITGEYIMTGYIRDQSTSTELTALSRCNSSLNFNLHKAYGNPGVNPTHRGIDIFEYPASSDYLIHGRSIEPFMTPGSLEQPYAIRTDLNGTNGCEMTRYPSVLAVTLDEFSETENPNPPIVNIISNPFPERDLCGNLADVCAPSLRISSNNPVNTLVDHRENEFNGIQVLKEREEKIDELFSVVPNPASTYVELNINFPYYENLNLTLTNINGQNVMEVKSIPATGNHRVSLPGLPAGLYILSLKTDQKMIKQQKLLISHE